MLKRSILPEERRKVLRSLFSSLERPIRLIEAHNGLSAMVAEDSAVEVSGGTRSFDGLWISGLTESASSGLPDIELIGMQSRVEMVREIVNVTHKPMIVDGDTGGTVDQLCFHARTLESLGVSGLVIEDKRFPKNNSLDFTKTQVLEDPDVFAGKIRAAKRALATKEFMIFARIEALVAKSSMFDALKRAEAYLHAGADAIVIHSREKTPVEVLEFARAYSRLAHEVGRVDVPLVAIPTTYNSITESELHAAGFKLVIHANHLLRSAYMAMKKTAETILRTERSLEAEPSCASLSSMFQALDGQTS